MLFRRRDLSDCRVAIIFADIRLEDGYSFEVFDAVSTDALIVFTTAYDEYALRAFDYNCIDYLLKPYGQQDLEDALTRFESRIRSTLGRNKILNLKPPFEQTEIVITAPVVKVLREKLSA